MSTGNVTRTQEIKSPGASMIADSGINHNDGSLLNNTLFVTGRYLKGIQLNGGNQSVSAYNNNDSLSLTDSVTIDLWMKPYATDALRVLVAKDKEGYPALGNYVLRIADGRLQFGYSVLTSGTDTFVDTWIGTTKQVIFTNRWYRVIASHKFGSASKPKIWVNNVEQTMGNWQFNDNIDFAQLPYTTPDNFSIGSTTSFDSNFSGILDELKIYNKQYSDPDFASGLISSWSFDTNTRPKCTYEGRFDFGMQAKFLKLNKVTEQSEGFTEMEFGYEVSTHIDSASLKIFTDKGDSIFETALNNLEAGTHTFNWNGLDNNGNTVKAGKYYAAMFTGSTPPNPSSGLKYFASATLGFHMTIMGSIPFIIKDSPIEISDISDYNRTGNMTFTLKYKDNLTTPLTGNVAIRTDFLSTPFYFKAFTFSNSDLIPFTWDGKNSAGQKIVAGEYYFEFTYQLQNKDGSTELYHYYKTFKVYDSQLVNPSDTSLTRKTLNAWSLALGIPMTRPVIGISVTDHKGHNLGNYETGGVINIDKGQVFNINVMPYNTTNWKVISSSPFLLIGNNTNPQENRLERIGRGNFYLKISDNSTEDLEPMTIGILNGDKVRNIIINYLGFNGKDKTRFGVNSHGVGGSNAQEELAKMSTIGVQWIRKDFVWHELFPKSPDVPDPDTLKGYEDVVCEAHKKNIKVLGLLVYAPWWAKPSGCKAWNCSPNKAEYYYDFVAYMVAHFK
ncbi:MAG: FlgD immunoglobulin-like domain containing protein, partial [Nitrospirota bacterium]